MSTGLSWGLPPEGLVHLGYVLMLVALLARDILWLRALLVAAQANLGVYASTQELGGMMFWNALFVLINTVWVLRILRQRRAVRLPSALEPVHRRYFAALTSQEFLAFWQAGSGRRAEGQRLVEKGVLAAELMFLNAGEVRVMAGIKVVAHLPAGSFIGEMSLLTGAPTSAAVDAVGEVELRCWPAAWLQQVRLRQPALWSKLQSVLGHDLIEKLRRAADAEAS